MARGLVVRGVVQGAGGVVLGLWSGGGCSLGGHSPQIFFHFFFFDFFGFFKKFFLIF